MILPQGSAKALKKAWNSMWKETLPWLETAIGAVERIGLVRAMFIVLTVAVAIGLVAIFKDFNNILNTVLTHRRESERSRAKIENDKKRLAVALEDRKRKVSAPKRQARS
ncbi:MULTISPECIES: hypothetical protein [unclassified Bradyrhizobium]|uniref:hypothetical protein n=1 Tax=Bradyrhizobium sp. USDA 4541 TaxID=2817704 RepID=UPI0020A5C6E2|nr:hypothetical protein [Bradyrhizobium sp. USDA 4541]MCP1854222.1 hypothetical protein [Bradyrhizobium sp. USDA 4541]